ncbi:MAG: hypothetical protein ACP5JP_04400 [bacterium]
MKIKCDKCNNEFFVKVDAHMQSTYTVRCPVCKNPITIKAHSNNTPYKKHEQSDAEYRSNMDNKMIVGAESISGTDVKSSTTEELKGNTTDMVQETDDEFYNDDELFKPGRNDSLTSILKAALSRIDIYSFTESFFYYAYYVFMFLFILTFLFVSSEVIKLDNLENSIGHFFQSIINVFKHYV